MLSETRRKEAESNVKNYLQEGLLKKEKFNPLIFSVFMKNAEESRDVATLLHSGKHSNLWTIVGSYYSMYYVANAVLYKLGYKIGDKIPHKVTADTLIVFARNKVKDSLIEQYEELKDEALAGIKADELVYSFDLERDKRGRIQYHTDEQAKRTKAETSIERSRLFFLEMKKII